jgi:hypothetical protein
MWVIQTLVYNHSLREPPLFLPPKPYMLDFAFPRTTFLPFHKFQEIIPPKWHPKCDKGGQAIYNKTWCRQNHDWKYNVVGVRPIIWRQLCCSDLGEEEIFVSRSSGSPIIVWVQASHGTAVNWRLVSHYWSARLRPLFSASLHVTI